VNNEQVKQFIVEQLEVYGPIETSDLNSFNFIDSGHIDSLGLMKFMIALEAEFDIKFTDDELLSDQFRVVQGLAELIRMKMI
jgi:acyl carrier protein